MSSTIENILYYESIFKARNISRKNKTYLLKDEQGIEGMQMTRNIKGPENSA